MIGRVLASDFVKIRRTMIVFLLFFGPFGVIGLQALNFGLRYDYLVKEYADDLWGGFLSNIQFLAAPALLLGLTIVISMIAGYEHQLNSWKQLLALPVTRFSVMASKFLLNFLLLLVSCILLAAGAVLLGLALGFGSGIPWGDVARMAFYPFVAALPIFTLQLWLSVTMKNQAIPLTVGIVGTILSLYAMILPDWVMWKWPLLINDAKKPELSVLAGAAGGAVLFLLASLHFSRKDVN